MSREIEQNGDFLYTQFHMNVLSDNIIAHFQPILSADSKTIYSYEVLGRFIDDDGKVQSLGGFFSDPNTSQEEALRVDRIVRRYALKKYAEEKRNEYLFINIRLAWLLPYINNPEEMMTLQWAKEFGIDPKKLVIEITEEEFNASEEWIRAIVHYKNIGCRIALDDYGKRASNIERLVKLQPNIIKINMDYIHKSENSFHYREYLRSIADFADSVEIEVLYEGIETQRQLDICMSLKGKYFQGFLTAVPQSSMSGAVINDTAFSASIENAYMALQETVTKTEERRKSLDIQVERFLAENPFSYGKNNYDEYLTKLCHELHDVRLVYLCDRRGEQLTPNFVLKPHNNGIELLTLYKDKNWAWRGYFHEAIKASAAGQKSCVSSAYHDFATKDKVRTYSYAIADTVFLFADIDEV